MSARRERGRRVRRGADAEGSVVEAALEVRPGLARRELEGRRPVAGAPRGPGDDRGVGSDGVDAEGEARRGRVERAARVAGTGLERIGAVRKRPPGEGGGAGRERPAAEQAVHARAEHVRCECEARRRVVGRSGRTRSDRRLGRRPDEAGEGGRGRRSGSVGAGDDEHAVLSPGDAVGVVEGAEVGGGEAVGREARVARAALLEADQREIRAARAVEPARQHELAVGLDDHGLGRAGRADIESELAVAVEARVGHGARVESSDRDVRRRRAVGAHLAREHDLAIRLGRHPQRGLVCAASDLDPEGATVAEAVVRGEVLVVAGEGEVADAGVADPAAGEHLAVGQQRDPDDA